MKQTSIYLTSGQIDELRRQSKATGLSVSAIVRMAVDLWLGTK